MTAAQLKMAAGRSDRFLERFFHFLRFNLCQAARLAFARSILPGRQREGQIPPSDLYTMKNINGSEATCNAQGLIVRFRDAEGRAWRFAYRNKKLIEFTDPRQQTWREARGGFQGCRQDGSPVAEGRIQAIEINQASGQVLVQQSGRKTTYCPDGTTILQVEQIKNGQAVEIKFSEYATRPCKSFVVVERHAGEKEYVTWIQDANGKLHQFEYEDGLLHRYTDVSQTPCVIWTAKRDGNGLLTGWSGRCRDGEIVASPMTPQLESVDPAGNRHFAAMGGGHFIVRPSGAAFSPSSLQGLDCSPGFAGFGGLSRYYSTFNS